MGECWGQLSHIFSLSNHLNSAALASVDLGHSLLWINTMCASVWHSPGYEWDSHYLLKLEDTIYAVHFRESTQITSGNLLSLPMENHPLSLCVLEKSFKYPSPFIECPAHTLQGHLQALPSGQHTQLYDVWVGCGNKQPNISPRLTHVSLRNICQTL